MIRPRGRCRGGKGFCAQEQNHEGARGQVMRIRIGYSLADRLISYPHRHNLSACSLPIRVGDYGAPIPDEIILPPSNKVTGQQKPIDTRVPETLEATARHLSEAPPGQDRPL